MGLCSFIFAQNNSWDYLLTKFVIDSPFSKEEKSDIFDKSNNEFSKEEKCAIFDKLYNQYFDKI